MLYRQRDAPAVVQQTRVALLHRHPMHRLLHLSIKQIGMEAGSNTSSVRPSVALRQAGPTASPSTEHTHTHTLFQEHQRNL